MSTGLPQSRTCFIERDPQLAVARRATAEGAGAFLLMLAASGVGAALAHGAIAAPAITLIASAAAIAGALVGLIVAFDEVSGGHLNPLITGLQYFTGARSRSCTLAYVVAQCLGAIVGALVSQGLFELGASPASAVGGHLRLAVSECIASAGLMTVVFSCMRSGKKDTGPFAVGAWLFAAIIATPSTSYANPAIALASLFATGPITLTWTMSLTNLPAEIVGAFLALVLLSITYPRTWNKDYSGRTTSTEKTS